MKTKISQIALFSALVLIFSGCSVKEKKALPLNNLDLAVEEVFADDIMEDVLAESYDILFDAFDYGILKSDGEPDSTICRTRTIERPEGERWPRTVTLDFGDGCEDWNGNVRSGKMIITISGPLKEENSTRILVFEDYFVNGNKIEGEKVMTNMGREDGFLVFNLELTNGKIIREDSSVIERDAIKTRIWIEGEETPVGRDDVFLISGTVNRVNKDGVQITKTIADMVRARNCRFPLSGIVEISTDNDRPLAILDYGEGECDRWATITIGEGEDTETWIIDLRKKGKNWKKQDDQDDGIEKDD